MAPLGCRTGLMSSLLSLQPLFEQLRPQPSAGRSAMCGVARLPSHYIMCSLRSVSWLSHWDLQYAWIQACSLCRAEHLGLLLLQGALLLKSSPLGREGPRLRPTWGARDPAVLARMRGGFPGEPCPGAGGLSPSTAVSASWMGQPRSPSARLACIAGEICRNKAQEGSGNGSFLPHF